VIQNSLERLFDGLVTTLRDVVAPAVVDPYARAQVSAAAELIANLATRVDWSAEYLGDVTRRVHGVLAQAAAAAGPGDLPVTRELLATASSRSSGACTVADRDDHLRGLAEVQQWLGSGGEADAAAAVRELLVWQLDEEALRMRTGMYRPAAPASGG